MIVRAGLLVAALLAIAWMAVGLHEARLFESASAVAVGPDGGLTPARAARANTDLRDAAKLLGHRDPAAFRARLLARTGHPAAALRLLEGLVRDEPDNATYWAARERTASGSNPALAALARVRLHQLDPRGAG